MAAADYRLATDATLSALVEAIRALPNETQAAADAAIAAAEAAVSAVSALGSLAAPDYSTSKTYSVGDYVYYSSHVYRCITAITTAEAWTAEHWEQVSMGNDIADMRDGMSDGQKAETTSFVIEDASIDPSGIVVPFDDPERDLFVCYIGGASTVTISNGELYSMFIGKPEFGKVGNERVMISMEGPVTVEVPYGFNYVAVRSEPDLVPMIVPDGNIQAKIKEIDPETNKGDLVIGHIDHAGIFAAGDINELEATNVYYAPVYGLESVYVSRGDFVGFYQFLPRLGLLGIMQRQAISDGSIVTIPEGAFYIGVRTLSNSRIYANSNKKTEWIVDKNGRGDFTKVMDAVAQASSGDTIRIRPGNYTDEIIEAFGKELYIIGEDRQSVIISNTLDQYDNPPIEMSVGLLENVTVEAVRNSQTAKGAYAMHNEDDFQFKKSFTVRNCIFKSASGAAVGMGMRGDYSVIFENCDFIATDYIANFGTSGYALYFHDTVQEEYVGSDRAVFRNCRIYALHGAGVAIRIDSTGLEGNTVEVEFIGNAVVNPNNSGGSYLSIHNNGGENSDWYGLKGFSNSSMSYGNQIDDINYSE